MKTSIAKLAVGLTLVSMSSVAMAGIANTKHNLGSTGTHNFSSSTTEICVFCHTPHGGDTSAAVPLWNRTLASSSSYTTYAQLGTSTLDSKSTTIGSVSLACLSCHDGTQAMNVVINSPGSGTSGDVNLDGTNYISKAAGVDCAATDGTCGGFNEFNYMSQVTEMIYLGTDLRNDHPISIQYAGSVGGGTSNDADFHAALDVTVASGTTVYYIDTDASGTKTKNDLPLYNRMEGSLSGEPLVECATCHDPHTETTTFLRKVGGNNSSGTCLACHDK
ncbi:MAG: cytochrome c3 family protein [Gallionella sp.]